MGTSKRERQKRNRDARRDERIRRTQRGRVRKRGVRVAVVMLLVVGLVGFVFLTGNVSDERIAGKLGLSRLTVARMKPGGPKPKGT